jgi:hypothetical protein
MNPSFPASLLLQSASKSGCCLLQPIAPVNGCNQGSCKALRGLATPPRLAKRSHALYLGKAEHFLSARVVRRDQNVSHLMVFGPKDASLLAR